MWLSKSAPYWKLTSAGGDSYCWQLKPILAPIAPTKYFTDLRCRRQIDIFYGVDFLWKRDKAAGPSDQIYILITIE